MQLPRFRFTIGQLIKLIACLAVLFMPLRMAGWPWMLAIGLMIVGFSIERTRGGPGIFGSRLAGAIALVAFGLMGLDLTHELDRRALGNSDVRFLLVRVAFLSMIGGALGVVVGNCLWLIALLLGVETGAGPLPSGPIGSRGFEDRSPEHPRAGGHRA